ncbi:MAG: curli production assembly/transport component CsgF [Bacteroidota bacterium]
MNQHRTLLIGLFFVVASSFSGLAAQQLVYRPINPAFGGETFNYSWLLSSAQAQDATEDPSAGSATSSFQRATNIETFQQQLNSQLLSQLSRNLVTSQFGEDGLDDGTYNIGTLEVSVATTLDGVNISIIDTNTGESTEVIIPFF